MFYFYRMQFHRRSFPWLVFSFLIVTVRIHPCDFSEVKINSRKIHSESVVGAYICIAASPQVVYSVLADYDNHEKFLPNTKESQILKRTGNALYVRKKLDFSVKTIEIYMNISLGNGKISWVTVPGFFKKNSGFWELKQSGAKTLLHYQIRTIPKYSIPEYFEKKVSSNNVEGLLRGVEKRSRQVKTK